MASTCLVFDPDGDVELILRNPNAPFAKWDEDQHPCKPLASALAKTSSKQGKRLKKRSSNELFFNLDDPGIMHTSSPSGPPAHPEGIELSSINPLPSESTADYTSPLTGTTPSEGTPVPAFDDNDTNDKKDVQVRMRVSSRHLMLASTYFEKMLQGPWEESKSYVIAASEWDTDAMVILMNIIHGRSRKVPRLVSLDLLTKLAVMADYYQCVEGVEMYADRWIKNLGHHLPERCGRDLILWIAVSWVFFQDSLFEAVTNVTIRESDGPLQTLGLPIPQHIVETIDRKRQDKVDRIISVPHDLVLYLNNRTKCTFACSSMLIGALTKQMHTNGLLYPKPTTPFLGYSVAGITKTLHNFETPKWNESRNSGMFKISKMEQEG
ncbi:hypothetical protein PG999_004521 [Apiospora kogelbergensis]|uniref:BTB domain-containing protein n=1 Tax=Apiospora kogelbergensis TaxID=1337665 RepID=A0AAW0QZG8_9PEZI